MTVIGIMPPSILDKLNHWSYLFRYPVTTKGEPGKRG
jgi:hypothetical protein